MEPFLNCTCPVPTEILALQPTEGLLESITSSHQDAWPKGIATGSQTFVRLHETAILSHFCMFRVILVPILAAECGSYRKGAYVFAPPMIIPVPFTSTLYTANHTMRSSAQHSAGHL